MTAKQFPIGIWNYAPIAHFDEARVEEWADCGLTTPMGPNFADKPADIAHMKRILDWSHKHGVQVIVCDPRTSAINSPTYAEGVDRAVRDFGSHPAFFGFHVLDEPGVAEWKATANAARVVGEKLPQGVPFVNHLPWYPGVESRVGFPTFDQYLDTFASESHVPLLCYDCYSQMNPNGEGLPMYWRNLETYRAAGQRHNIPFWNTILSVGHFHYRSPSEDDIRWQFNTTIAYGAKGVLYFFFYMRMPHDNYRLAPIDEFWERTPAYYALKRTNRGFLRKWGDLMLGLRNTSVSFWPKAPAPATRTWEPSAVLKQVDADRPHLLISEFVDAENRPYVMVVNNSTTDSAHATLGFAGKQTRAFVRDWDGKEAEFGLDHSGDLARAERWLAPGQMEIWRVQS